MPRRRGKERRAVRERDGGGGQKVREIVSLVQENPRAGKNGEKLEKKKKWNARKHKLSTNSNRDVMEMK